MGTEEMNSENFNEIFTDVGLCIVVVFCIGRVELLDCIM